MVSLSNHERTALPPASPELAERLSAQGFLYNQKALTSKLADMLYHVLIWYYRSPYSRVGLYAEANLGFGAREV